MKIAEALEIILRQVEHDLAVDHIGKVEKLREAFDIFKANQDLRAEIEDYLALAEGKKYDEFFSREDNAREI